MAAKVHARAEAAVLVFAEWADACGMWLEASSARVAINQPATGLQLHGSITQALEWAVDAWESVRTVSLRLDDAEPFDDSYCITVVLQALAASCPMLHTLLLDNTIKGVGTLRVVREVFPDITKARPPTTCRARRRLSCTRWRVVLIASPKWVRPPPAACRLP